MKRLETFTEEEYEKLKASGMFWEIYPDATGNYASDTKPREKCITINHAGNYQCYVYLNKDGNYSIPEDYMEDIVEKIGDFDVVALAHILTRLQEANDAR